VQECKGLIQQAYDAASVAQHLGAVVENDASQIVRLRSIGLRRTIGLDEFKSPDYYWQGYFADVGRAIARGERNYLHRRIGRQVTGKGDTMSRSNPDFSVLSRRIAHLSRSSPSPDVLLAPVSLSAKFALHYGSQIDWTHGHPEQLQVGHCRLKVLWSHKYAPLDSFVVLSSTAAVWHVLPDPTTGSRLSIALGESDERDDRVEYYVETLARYEILDTAAFWRINLASRDNESALDAVR
jgi:hypothetical protein